MKVYIAGPYTNGDVAVNVRTAMRVGLAEMEKGHAVFIPHLAHFLHLLDPHPYTFWVKHDLLWVKECDKVIRIKGHSKGADEEVAYAHELGISVSVSE